MLAHGERMPGWKYRDLAFGVEFLDVETGRLVEWPMKNCYIGAAGAKDSFLLTGATQHDVDADRIWLGGVSV
jgi:aromatic ring-cleaving dioxygenase